MNLGYRELMPFSEKAITGVRRLDTETVVH